MGKSVLFAYILLFIGGFVGLHLLYLRRDKQAFLYWCTFGGYFGLGPIRDFYYLSTYVKEANNDSAYMADLAKSMRKHKKPPCSVVRFVAQVLIANSWCYLFIAAVPDEEMIGINLSPMKYLGPLASALGVWLIGNIGREKGDFKWCAIGAYAVLPLVRFNFHSINWSCISAALLFEWKGKTWRRTPSLKHSFCKRFMYLNMGWFLFCSLWASYIYFNAEIKHADGGTVKLKDSIRHFFKSPMFVEFKKNLWRLLEDIRTYGFKQAWTNFIDLVDPLGELYALTVLGLEKGASQEEITSRFKNLSREWHPDRHKTSEEKEIAQEKFVEIADAYEKLSSIKKRRSKINRHTSR